VNAYQFRGVLIYCFAKFRVEFNFKGSKTLWLSVDGIVDVKCRQ
jgi:hypothetical protein